MVRAPAFIPVPALYSHSLSPRLKNTPFSTLLHIAALFKRGENLVSSAPPTESSVAQVCVCVCVCVCSPHVPVCVLVCGPFSSCKSIIRFFFFSWSCTCLHVYTEKTVAFFLKLWGRKIRKERGMASDHVTSTESTKPCWTWSFWVIHSHSITDPR